MFLTILFNISDIKYHKKKLLFGSTFPILNAYLEQLLVVVNHTSDYIYNIYSLLCVGRHV